MLNPKSADLIPIPPCAVWGWRSLSRQPSGRRRLRRQC